MRSVNKVILIGNLTRDPEMRQTANGQMVTTFCIATNREWITKDSKKHSLTEYHDIVAWARLAEICSKYLKKSKLVYIEGYLKTRSWDTPEGVKKFRTEIVAQDMIMLEKRPKNLDNNNDDDDDDYLPQEDNDGDDDDYENDDKKEEEKEKKDDNKKEDKDEKSNDNNEKDDDSKDDEKDDKKEDKDDKDDDDKPKLDISGDLGL
ncbi:single-stranded DNA-binding protein [Candidatus Peregrinibacteria bacterium]|nr:single-stranded DNA-binding protein [Candidatus Peregrinibacteria bacterium]